MFIYRLVYWSNGNTKDFKTRYGYCMIQKKQKGCKWLHNEEEEFNILLNL